MGELWNRTVASIRCDWEDTRPATRHTLGALYLTIGLIGLVCLPWHLLGAPVEVRYIARRMGMGLYVGVVFPVLWQLVRAESVEHWEAELLERDVDEWRAEVEARRDRAAHHACVTENEDERNPTG